MRRARDAEGLSASERREISAKNDIKAEAIVARQKTAKLKEQRLSNDLAKADRDVNEGERQIAEQKLVIEDLYTGGFDTKEAEALLQTLEQHLAEWHAHRDEIVRQLKFLAGQKL